MLDPIKNFFQNQHPLTLLTY